MKIGFIGTGAMGGAMISALVKKNIVIPGAIWGCDLDEARLAELEDAYEIKCTSNIDEIIKTCEVIVLSIKPQVLNDVASQLKGKLKSDQVVLSIVAGATIDTINKLLGHDRIVRAMPNTPAQVGEGISVWTSTTSVSQDQSDHVQVVLSSMGKKIYVSDEKYLDMATAVSGSGPAYIFLIMEALIDAAVHIGMPRNIASELVIQTVLGSAYMTRETGKHPAELKNMVTSPGGTTAEGLHSLEEGGIRAVIADAIIAAYEKAQALGGNSVK